ncbi:MAG: lipid-A-disaccharide synthase, partial [Nitratireductor sp.]|nr:lipid-A-disaccharide synthase [Nitratireductor sp.]
MADARQGLSVYFVLGEESGDALGARIMEALARRVPSVQFHGLGGHRMQALGLSSLFDVSTISVMGISAVVARLPQILKRIGQTADDIARVKPDIVVLVDSPDFTHRVA